MKKILLIVLVLVVAVMFSACGADDTNSGNSRNGQNGSLNPNTSGNGSFTSDMMPSMPDGNTGNSDMNTPADSSASNGQVASDVSISREEAIDIALKQAGVTKENVRGLEAELDRERSIIVWEVDFESGNMEYSYDINARTGAITERNKEFDN